MALCSRALLHSSTLNRTSTVLRDEGLVSAIDSIHPRGTVQHTRWICHSVTYVRLSEIKPRSRRFGTAVLTLGPLGSKWHSASQPTLSDHNLTRPPAACKPHRSGDGAAQESSMRPKKRKQLRVALPTERASERGRIRSGLQRLARQWLRRIDLPRIARPVRPAG